MSRNAVNRIGNHSDTTFGVLAVVIGFALNPARLRLGVRATVGLLCAIIVAVAYDSRRSSRREGQSRRASNLYGHFERSLPLT